MTGYARLMQCVCIYWYMILCNNVISNANRPHCFLSDEERPVFYEDERPFYHFFVWAILMNRREMAEIFWEKDTDYICKLFNKGPTILCLLKWLSDIVKHAFENQLN